MKQLFYVGHGLKSKLQGNKLVDDGGAHKLFISRVGWGRVTARVC